MDTSKWLAIETVFNAAVDIPSHQRDAYVATACHGDAELELEVRRLLAADAVRGDPLRRVVERHAADFLAPGAASLWVGRHIGAWRIDSVVERH